MNKLAMALSLCLCMSSLPTNAATDAEHARARKPMPHQAMVTDAAKVNVHFSRLDSYLEGRPDNASQLARLKTRAQQCVREHRETGRPVNPPRAWPDHLLSNRTDLYSSSNRSITYQSGLTYSLLENDCSLQETAEETAVLSSSMGACTVDLRKMTAIGVCDAQAHAHARPPMRVSASSLTQIDSAIRKAPDNPGLAALAAVMRQHPMQGTGERKMILGIACEVWKNPLTPDGKDCLSLGGSFTAANAGGGHGQSNLTLEMTSVGGIQAHAVEAKLDAMVNGAVFAPYLAGGFTIINRMPRK